MVPDPQSPRNLASERPGLDNITSELWSDTIWPRTIASGTLSCLFKQNERDKVELST